ncbi:HesB/IscA family protein [Inmirania thermothiophila]|uniref:Iron-sulfur cluster insertion protein n=1 Tax=Inmirania thermothiophila TaxID=1750597 RepID=A0A3N1Y7I4_9GAMM|nr:iron-sulfur cluster assembly accessory protein [Inmirania thermothiophila]ROR34796.1 iron-sulfur cluster insertion protein [Inmirania thermothiophila]
MSEQIEARAEAGAVVDFPRRIGDEDIRLTEAARVKLAQLLAEADEEIRGVRVFVSGGGCGGMTYGMTFTDTETPYDAALEKEGVTIYVDAVALNYLRGAEIDYVERPMGASFVFRNVFAAVGGSGACSACGAAGGGCA